MGMPQIHFPFFPDGVTHIGPNLAFGRKEGKIRYFNGATIIDSHDENDHDAFKSKIGEFCALGVITQAEASRAFGITATSVKRAVKLYLRSGVRGFFASRRTRRLNSPGGAARARIAGSEMGFV